MRRGSDARRRHIDLAWIGHGVSDEFRNGIGWERWMHHHDAGLTTHTRDRRNVAEEIETEFIVKRRIDRGWRTDQEECVAFWWRAHDRLTCDIAASARPVL